MTKKREKRGKKIGKILKFLKNANYKKEGITLIALVITIIVLLILAGVSIATLTRRKWIINKGNISCSGNKKSGSRGTSRTGSNRKL